jgi:hypothetical protein
MKSVGLIGSSGFIGREISKSFSEIDNLCVMNFSSKSLSDRNCFYLNLLDTVDNQITIQALKKCDYIVLLSWIWEPQGHKNYDFFNRILKYLRNDCIIINVSSFSAFSTINSKYGVEKRKVENLITQYSGINIRLGLVLSDQTPSLLIKYIELVRFSNFLLNFKGLGSSQFTIRNSEVSDLISKIVNGEGLTQRSTYVAYSNYYDNIMLLLIQNSYIDSDLKVVNISSYYLLSVLSNTLGFASRISKKFMFIHERYIGLTNQPSLDEVSRYTNLIEVTK